MRLTLLTTLSMTVLVTVSCNSNVTSKDEPVTRHTRSRVTPMKYDQWESQSFDYIGLKVDLPTQAQTSPSAKGPAELAISLHYLSPPPGVLDDATVFIHVYVKRITLDQFAEQKTFYLGSGLYKRGDEQDHKTWFWYYDLHPETSRWDGRGKYSYYRRDVKLNDKEILHANAEVLNAGPQESQDADHATTKRILDSIQPLNTTTNK